MKVSVMSEVRLKPAPASEEAHAIPAASDRLDCAIRAARVFVRLWTDDSGEVQRLQVISSTGDAELDGVLRDEVIASLALDAMPDAGRRKRAAAKPRRHIAHTRNRMT
jgi:hypothetical protein